MVPKKITYREAIEEVELILSQIEKEEPDIDELSEKVKRVAYLLRLCREKLHKTSEEVEKILGEMED